MSDNMTVRSQAKLKPVFIGRQCNKLVKGGENFTMETMTKLEDILGIAIIADSIRERKTGM